MAIEAEFAAPFAITVTADEVDPVICVDGDVDLASAPYLGDAIVAAIAVGAGPVIVDLAAVNFLNSTGLGVLVSSHKRLESQPTYVAFTQQAGVQSARTERPRPDAPHRSRPQR